MEPQRRRRKVKTVAADAVPPGTHVDDVPDDLLELILLHLDSPIWLNHAASTCKRWRSIIADDGGAFLRHIRSLHPPTIVGHYHHREQFPPPIEFIPTPLPPPVRIDTNCFSLDFLLPPDVNETTAKLEVVDCHGGLVLLKSFYLKYLVVYDPLTRRCQRVDGTLDQLISGRFFLIDGEDGTISVSDFWVFRTVFSRKYGEPWSCVFSTATIDHDSWRSVPPSRDELEMEDLLSFAGRVDGSLYLGTVRGSVTVLGNVSLELNKVHLPSRVNTLRPLKPSMFCVVAHCARDGNSTSPPALCIVHVKGDELEVFRRVHNGSSGGEWVHEHSIHRLYETFGRLPAAGYPEKYYWIPKVVIGGVGFVILLVSDYGYQRWPFSLCLDTMEVKVVPESSCYGGTRDASIYTLPWPPLMRACVAPK